MSKDSAITIRSPKRQTLQDFVEIWEYRYLLKTLVWRELKARYRHTTFGVAWFVLQPLVFMLVITVGLRFAFPGDLGGLPYPMYVASGLVLWTYFGNGFPTGANSLQSYQSMINKVAFPHACLPLVPSITAAVDMLAASLLLIPMMMYYEIIPSWRVVFLPFIIAGTGLFIYSLALLFSGASSVYKDFRHVVPFLTQLMFFGSPVFISGEYVQGKIGLIFLFNPFVTYLNAFRWAIFPDYAMPPLHAFAIAGGMTIILFLWGLFYFQRQQSTIVDIL